MGGHGGKGGSQARGGIRNRCCHICSGCYPGVVALSTEPNFQLSEGGLGVKEGMGSARVGGGGRKGGSKAKGGVRNRCCHICSGYQPGVVPFSTQSASNFRTGG